VGSSALYDGEMIFNDETPESVYDTDIEGQGRGLMLDMRGPGDYEYGEFASPFPDSLLVPMSEMEDRIKEMEETKSRVSDLCTQANLSCKNQASTNYCWINSPVYIMEVNQIITNQPVKILSPASGGARIKNFRNVGGWGREAVEWMSKNGINTVDEWPANAIDQRFNTAQNQQIAKTRLFVEWIELRPRNMHQLLSLLVRRIPVTGGFNWWRHQVSLIDPVWLDGAPAIRQRNSWGMQWGAQGYGILQGSKALPDDAVAIVSNRLFVR
jgi:hypothetical protein